MPCFLSNCPKARRSFFVRLPRRSRDDADEIDGIDIELGAVAQDKCTVHVLRRGQAASTRDALRTGLSRSLCTKASIWDFVTAANGDKSEHQDMVASRT
jgi:hypothetical protein